jgi:hypothetical protein
MRKSHFNDEFLVMLGPIISRLFTCSNEEKTKGAYSSPISMEKTEVFGTPLAENMWQYSQIFLQTSLYQ